MLGQDVKWKGADGKDTWLGKELMLGSQWNGVKDLNTAPVLKAAFLDEEFPDRRDGESEQAYLARLIATCPADVYDTPVDSRSVQKHLGFDPFGFEKHKGPGNHPNGTPQSVHAGGGASERPGTYMPEVAHPSVLVHSP